MKALKTTYTFIVIAIVGLIIAVVVLSLQLSAANRGDLNHDGIVNDDDATLMYANWKK